MENIKIKYILIIAFMTLPLMAMMWFAPDYLFHRGFPLDDAWIHMVYGRSLAHEHLLAYNPGSPAVGETSPLWALVLAIPHMIPISLESRVAMVKLTGWALHATGATFIGLALSRFHRKLAIISALAILLHPELAAASVSGMEVPLAEAIIAMQLWGIISGREWVFVMASCLAPFARPEVGILAPTLGFLCAPGGTLRQRLRWGGLGLAGATIGYTLMFGRNYGVSGSFLPATFHQKVASGVRPKLDSMTRGLSVMLPSLVPIPPLGLAGVTFGFVWMAFHRTPSHGEDSRPIWIGITGLGLITVCSALVYPKDIAAFYHRRYLLVGLPLLLVGITQLGGFLTSRFHPSVRWLLALGWIGVLLAMWPARFRHLDNDAHNIDDVQVTLGHRLGLFPPGTNFWAVDAGAVRYFGVPFVVDTLGLNTPEINGGGGSRFLASHPAHAMEVVPTWNRLDLPPGDVASIQLQRYAPSTPYTVTEQQPMAIHLLLTTNRPVWGKLHILSRVYPIQLRPIPVPSRPQD